MDLNILRLGAEYQKNREKVDMKLCVIYICLSQTYELLNRRKKNNE